MNSPIAIEIYPTVRQELVTIRISGKRKRKKNNLIILISTLNDKKKNYSKISSQGWLGQSWESKDRGNLDKGARWLSPYEDVGIQIQP